MEVLSHEEKPFPPVENLEGRLNAVFNIVNTELKSATMLALDDSPTEASEIKARIREMVGKSYLPRANCFEEYCHITIFPIGAVAEETVKREDSTAVHYAYSLTEAGRKYGQPIATLALQYVANMGLSLHQILGSTSSKGKTRAPLNRIKVLKSLSQEENSMVGLANKVGVLRCTILTYLRDLQKIGFIDYDSVGECLKGRGVVIYRLVDGNVGEAETVRSYPILTKKALALLRERKAITLPEAKKLLNVNESNFSIVCDVYSRLVEQGLATRDRGFKSRERFSNARILDRARPFLEFESKIEDILSDRISVQEAQSIYLDFVKSQVYEEIVRTAIKQYTQVSGHINRRGFEERADSIRRLLVENPGLRPSEIIRALNFKGVSIYLSPMLKSGVLRVEKQGKEARYYVNE